MEETTEWAIESIMKFSQTDKKLGRCEELLKMLESKEKEHRAYDALLEAVIGEGRAVTWILQKEITKVAPKVRDWYEVQAKEMALPRNNLLTWLRDARNVSTKQEPLGVGDLTRIRSIRIDRMPPGTGFAITNRGEPVWVTKDEKGREVQTHASEFDKELTVRHIIVSPSPPSPLLLDGRDLSGADATLLARLYIGFLRHLLEQAEGVAAG